MTGTESLNGQRPPRQTEAAAYFACLEAMQNAAKHAPGAAVCVDIGLADGVLSFTVSDDGPGFDPAAPEGGGTGLLGMADRVGAAGGALSIRSTPGNGTTVSGRLPASPYLPDPPDKAAPLARCLSAFTPIGIRDATHFPHAVSCLISTATTSPVDAGEQATADRNRPHLAAGMRAER